MITQLTRPENIVKILQQSNCEVCSEKEPGGLKAYVLDGEIRGLLCSSCFTLATQLSKIEGLTANLLRFMERAQKGTTESYKKIKSSLQAYEYKDHIATLRAERKELRRLQREQKKAHKCLLDSRS